MWVGKIIHKNRVGKQLKILGDRFSMREIRIVRIPKLEIT